MRYPPGIYMTDSLTGTYYKIDADGKPTSRPQASGEYPPVPASGAAHRDPVPPSESQEEEKSRLPTLVMACSALVLALAGVIYYRSRRADR